jgi:chromate reductase
MPSPRILVFADSIRTGSFNARLAALAAKELALLNIEVTRISLVDYPLPLYNGDTEAEQGAPHNAVKLKQLFGRHHGVFIASPEYNASITPLLKNTLTGFPACASRRSRRSRPIGTASLRWALPRTAPTAGTAR